MQKVRVYQLAKELKVQSALILELLDRLGQDVIQTMQSSFEQKIQTVTESASFNLTYTA